MERMERIEQLILEQAGRSPDAVAVEYDGARLSYSEMARQARRISAALRGLGVVTGEAVVLCQERSLATVPLLLGVWDAGGVVVPVNPNSPAKMLEWIIQDSSPRIIFTDAAIEDRVAAAAGKVGPESSPMILTDVPGLDGRRSPSTEPSRGRARAAGDAGVGEKEDTCYVIYTSGSEGRPKGVVGSHRSLTQYVRWQAGEFSITGADRFSQIAPLSFDFSLKEILVPLIRGARVCIADRNSVVLDPAKFISWVAESGITVMCCVPTLARSILQLPDSPDAGRALQSVRHVLISGDMLRWEDVLGWRKRFGNAMALCNLYGPTESTVIKLFYPIPEERCQESVNVPVGRPIEGAEVLIVGEDDQPCPPGQTGEIIILSEWLARGYFNGGQAGGRSFCLLDHGGKQTRAYRTGDLGRLLSSGNIELVGRKDRQVKIRGHRVELDGVESVLAEHAGVRDVAVLALDGADAAAGDEAPALACYFTSDGSGVTEKELSAYARESLLPQVVSSTRFTHLEEMPLTPNGKVDRFKLKSLAAQNGNGEHARERRSAQTSVRQRILTMWQELLSLDGIDLEANFFQLGGDSMTAIRLLRRMREELHPEINLGDVYEFPSVSQLSDRVNRLLAQEQ
jgi:amino acid adenylation domain-containing protein